MSGHVTRRELLAAGGGLALATVGGAGFAQAQQTFNWKKYDGTTLRVLTLKFPLSEIQEKRLGDFQQLTGIKVELGSLARGSAAPEGQGRAPRRWHRSRRLSELLGPGRPAIHGVGLVYRHVADDPQRSADEPRLQLGRFHPGGSGRARPSTARFRSFPIARRPCRSCISAVICSHSSSSIVRKHGTTCAMPPR